MREEKSDNLSRKTSIKRRVLSQNISAFCLVFFYCRSNFRWVQEWKWLGRLLTTYSQEPGWDQIVWPINQSIECDDAFCHKTNYVLHAQGQNVCLSIGKFRNDIRKWWKADDPHELSEMKMKRNYYKYIQSISKSANQSNARLGGDWIKTIHNQSKTHCKLSRHL